MNSDRESCGLGLITLHLIGCAGVVLVFLSLFWNPTSYWDNIRVADLSVSSTFLTAVGVFAMAGPLLYPAALFCLWPKKFRFPLNVLLVLGGCVFVLEMLGAYLLLSGPGEKTVYRPEVQNLHIVVQ